MIAYIGGFTALLAALIAVQQNDIKRILAYSTLSQLGYMVMAVGLNGPTPAMFHLTTHAFFKALLFLGAGSVILGMHHEQDIWNMGGLRKKMGATFWTFIVGTLALAGIAAVERILQQGQHSRPGRRSSIITDAVRARRVRRHADVILHVPAGFCGFLSARRNRTTRDTRTNRRA